MTDFQSDKKLWVEESKTQWYYLMLPFYTMMHPFSENFSFKFFSKEQKFSERKFYLIIETLWHNFR